MYGPTVAMHLVKIAVKISMWHQKPQPVPSLLHPCVPNASMCTQLLPNLLKRFSTKAYCATRWSLSGRGMFHYKYQSEGEYVAWSQGSGKTFRQSPSRGEIYYETHTERQKKNNKIKFMQKCLHTPVSIKYCSDVKEFWVIWGYLRSIFIPNIWGCILNIY